MILLKKKSLDIIWGFLSPKRKTQFFVIVLLMMVSTIIEAFSVGVIFPFIGAITHPENIINNEFFKKILIIFNVNSNGELVYFFAISFIAAILVAGIFRLGMMYLITRYSFIVGHEVSLYLFKNIIYRNYQFHINRSSSESLSDIVNKANNIIYNALLPYLRLISSFFLLFGILILMLVANPTITFFMFTGLGGLYFLLIKLLKSKINTNSKIATVENVNLIKVIQEAVSGIREVILNNCHSYYISKFSLSSDKLRRAQRNNTFIEGSPRFLIETIALIFFGVVILVINSYSANLLNALPIFMLIGLSAQRLLPVFQTMYSSWASIQSVSCDLNELATTFVGRDDSNYQLNTSQYNELNFKNKVHFNNVCFSYLDSCNVILHNVNVNIFKGKITGIVGVSGSGKSTFLDLFAGLIEPISGHIYVDGERLSMATVAAWQKKISYVSQNIFLSDCSIAENIALGSSLPDINFELLEFVCGKAQLSDFISSLTDGYMTVIGERGSRLSGGQRQRLGIARALYKKSEVIIFDEATSALDVITERSVMETIYSLGPSFTILIVAHRISTLSHCDHIYEVKNNSIEMVK